MGLVVLVVDERMILPIDMPENVQVRKVPPTILRRLCAERWLAQNVQQQDIVLCFGNLPPLFKLRGRAVIFVQNRYLIDEVQLSGFPLKVKLRLALERLWLFGRMSNANGFIVQTPTMKMLLDVKTKGKIPVKILPFVFQPHGYARNALQPIAPKETDFDFVYVASGEPHKNHQRLLEAWCLLAEEGLFPRLGLTLSRDRFAAVCNEIEMLRQRDGLRITNSGELSHEDVLLLYGKSGALIYPSTFESFGLPLIEARQAGLPVLASELDYVRDVLDPEQTFDPASPRSIARAVKRFMRLDEQALLLLDATVFIERVVSFGDGCNEDKRF
jgi:glycosyltransferase involved in cell wall biosynthesis